MIHTKRIQFFVLALLSVALLGACGGSSAATVAEMAADVALSGAANSAVDTQAGTIDAAQATVSARSLRVRAEPSATATVVGGIKEGEVYTVIGLSSDGEWVQLAVPAIPSGEGWVSANFVSVEGAITGATITEAVPAPAPAAADTGADAGADTASGTTGFGINLPTPTPAIGPQPEALPGTATVTTEGLRLRVRAEPAADAEIVGYVYNGEVFAVTGTSDDGLWTQIGGRTGTDNLDGGWVSTEFLVLN
jgi:uncharacterized protein YgiM (DUF1202 family)